MYLWKCWRDTRWFFVVFLAIAALPMPMAAFASHFGTVIRDAGPMAFQNTFMMVVTAVAYALATICAIQEFTDKTAHFLFTKPRSRSYFVWTSWIVGFTELLIVAAVNLFVGWRVLAHYGVSAFSDGGPQSWNLVSPQSFIEAAIYACFAYALTFALAAILRSGLKGLGASLGLLAGMVGASVALQMRWKIHLPVPPQQIGHLPLALSECAWVMLALLFVLAAQLVVERAEI
jgi:ABC-type transport system involved in multi-copper enzyme maturation permease subunit